MGLPQYFDATTLRAIVATTGSAPDRVRSVAERAALTVHLGNGAAAELSARLFVELAARTVGHLSIEGGAPDIREGLRSRARAINSAIEDVPRSVTPVRIALQSDTSADVTASSHGWWMTLDKPQGAGAAGIGALAAAVIAYNEAFKRSYRDVLPGAVPIERGSWSLLRWEAGPLDPEDLREAPRQIPHTALVGCGAIGQAVAYAMGTLDLRGRVDLIDPQVLSGTNLQRYLGTRQKDARQQRPKAYLASRQLQRMGPRQLSGHDWAAYRRQGGPEPEIVLSALDSAGDRRLLQGALPRFLINGWTRTTACGATTHLFSGEGQCIVCTYLPRTPGASTTELARLVDQLGLEAMRVVALMAGSPLDVVDVRAIERHRKLRPDTLREWRGESIRPLFGHLCGLAEIESDQREQYVVPFAQTSVLAGVLMVAHLLQAVLGRVNERPIDVELLRGPGAAWALPPALRREHPAPCICKDPTYLGIYGEKWARPA